MTHVFEVDDQDIEDLDDKQLTALLRKLLVLEARRRGITAAAVQVSLKIDAPDGGEDGRIEWQGGADADPNGWLPSRNTLYQVKATKLGPTSAGNEVLLSKSTSTGSIDAADGGANQELKPRVAATVSAGGAYVLFYGKHCNKDMEPEWIAKIRASFVASGVPNSDSAPIIIFDRGRIATWTNQHAAAVTYVLEKVGKEPPIGAMTWATWRGYADLQGPFVWDADRTSYVKSLRDLLRAPRRVARLVGLSGRGKTRLALETLRCPDAPDDDIEQYALSTRSVYVIADQAPNLPAAIRAWRARGQEGVLVVDECSLDNHTDLAKEVEHSESRFSLLTIDYDPDSRPAGSTPVIELGALLDDGIKEIVGAGHSALGAGVLARLVSFAQGFPRIAVLLRELELSDGGYVPLLDDTQLAERLVWGRGSADPKALRVIQACSLFEHFGIDGGSHYEGEFIAQKMCGLSTEEFRGICHTFLSRKILYRRGDYIRVTPPPLAMHLASQWFDGTPVDEVVQLLTKQVPHGMVDAMGPLHRHIRDIRTPHLVRPNNGHAPQQIGVDAMLGMARRQLGLGIHRFDAHQTHQPLHPFSIDMAVFFAVQPPDHPSRAPRRLACVLLIEQTHQLQILRTLAAGLDVKRAAVDANQRALSPKTHLAVRLHPAAANISPNSRRIFFQPLQLHLQLADLLIQLFNERFLAIVASATTRFEQPGQTVQHNLLPFAHLRRMNLVLAGQLRQRLSFS